MCTYWEDAVRDFYRIQKIQYINKKIRKKRQKQTKTEEIINLIQFELYRKVGGEMLYKDFVQDACNSMEKFAN